MRQSVSRSVCQSVRQSVSPSVSQSSHQSVSQSVRLSVSQFVSQSVSQSVGLLVTESVRLNPCNPSVVIQKHKWYSDWFFFIFLNLTSFIEVDRTYYESYSPWRRHIHDMCLHLYWDVAIAIVICLNVLCMSLEHYQMSEVRNIRKLAYFSLSLFIYFL